jgi:hypothetical protein
MSSTPTHRVKYLNPQASRRNPPPIPKREVPENILRAREQIAKERNLQRAREITEKAKSPFGRSAGLSKAQLEKVEADFQAGIIRDEELAQQKRDAERQAIHDFQNRTGRINSRELARRRKHIEDSRNHGQHLARELLAVALIKRRFGKDIPIDKGEEAIKQYLGAKYGEDKVEGLTESFGRQLDALQLPRKAGAFNPNQVKATSTKPLREKKPPPIPRKQKEQPQPEPEPILEPEPEPVVQFKTGGVYEDAGKYDDVIMGTITKDEYARRFGVGGLP